jgi:hypothetical protein
MNKKLLTLAIVAPLLYTACNSTAAKPKTIESTLTQKETVHTIVKVETPKKLKTKIFPKNSKLTTVNFISDKPLIQEEGLLHIEGFMGTLKPTLINLMTMDKTHEIALGGCSSMAMSMTNDYSNLDPRINIRRTALQYSNPKNAPDKTDSIVMESFRSSKNFKKPLVSEMPDHYRVYKALAMKKECMSCHGDIENMSPKLVKMIDKIYPKDLATGLKLGAFRGVVIAEIKK